MFALLQCDAKAGITHTSALPSLPSLSTAPVIFICHSHTCIALPIHWKLHLICQRWHTHGSRCLFLFLPHMPCPSSIMSCLHQQALLYLMAGATCHHCDMQACPVCLSNPAGTSWLDSLHVDRWTMGGWMITHINNCQTPLNDQNKHRHMLVIADKIIRNKNKGDKELSL